MMRKFNSAKIWAGRIAVFVLLTAFCSLLTVYAQGGGIKGKVRNPKGGGIAGATVTARQDGKDVRSVRSDAKGNFVMEGLRSGVYNIVFDADGYSSGVKYGVEVEKKVRDLGDRLILGVDPGNQIILKGLVFFKEGFSVTGAEVTIEKVNADGSTKEITETFSDSSGEFAYRVPSSGISKLRVTAKYKAASASKEIEIGGPAIYRLAITLDISKSDK
jgi:uncharacterized GH25 family protein